MRTFYCLMLCATLHAGGAVAQPIRTNPGGAQDYVILRQPQNDHEVILQMRPSDPSAQPNEFDWQRWDPNDGGYTEARRIRWRAAASCGTGIDWIAIAGPGGNQTRGIHGSMDAMSGHTVQDSFDPNALDQVCAQFAREATQACGENPILEAGCQTEATFVFGPTRPLPRSDVLRVSGSCLGGTLPIRQYTPRLRLTCRLGE
ncbi:hypothetical protein MWU52_10750 [Jannaschia sp. S6380]|uniref:hypothetical protein n=1 Tax=Jannaschia sp. S6380 TaxID=2926408 RepID=UPI001FF68027|nr:hypothetical protein [Jannaschia sp. S6380]MCK0168030.1 hypothetical protein [Jannaschia sp. S6380]